MISKLYLFFAGEIVVGIMIAIMYDISAIFPSAYFLLKFLRLALAVTFYVAMNLRLFSYRNKYVNIILYIYFLIAIFFISNMGSLSLFQWCGYKLCRYTLNLM